MASESVEVAKIVVAGHVRTTNELFRRLNVGHAKADSRSAALVALKHMALLESELSKKLSAEELEEVSASVTNSLAVWGGEGESFDSAAANLAFGLPETSHSTVTKHAEGISATGIPGEAAVFGIFILAYSCCNGSGSGILIGPGAVKSCGDGFRVAGCP
jgi:hypothetical protein